MKKLSVVSPFVVSGGLLLLSPQALLPRAHADWVMVKMQASFDVSGEGQETNRPASRAPWTGAPQTRVFESLAYPTNSGGGSGIQMSDYMSFIVPPSPYAASGGRGGKAVASVKGHDFKAFLEWRGSGTPTDECYLRLRTQTEASVGGISASLPKWRYSVSDGKGGVKEGHKYDNTLPPGGGYGPYYEWEPSFKGGGGGYLFSQKFIRLDTSSRTLRADGVYVVEKTLDISPVAEAALSTSYGGGDPAEHADATTRMDAVLVTRSVIITSNLGQTFRKSLTQPPTQPGQTPLASIPGSSPPVWRVPVAPEATQESAAIYKGDRSGGLTLNEQNYGASEPFSVATANTLGFSIPQFQWSLSGGTPTGPINGQLGVRSTALPQIDIGSRSQGTDTDNYTTTGIALGGTASNLGVKSSTFTVNVFETDTSKPLIFLNDSYTVNWHLPEDDWKANGNSWTIRQPYDAIADTVVPNGRAIRGGNLTGDFRWNKYSYADHATAEAINLIFQVASNAPNNGRFAAFLTALGLGYNEWMAPPVNETHIVTWDSAWNDACNNPQMGSSFLGDRPLPGMENDPDVQAKYRMVNPKIVVKYKIKPMKGDQYDAHGYVGSIYRVGEIFENSTMAADFERNQ